MINPDQEIPEHLEQDRDAQVTRPLRDKVCKCESRGAEPKRGTLHPNLFLMAPLSQNDAHESIPSFQQHYQLTKAVLLGRSNGDDHGMFTEGPD